MPHLDDVVDEICRRARTVPGDVRDVVLGITDDVAPLAPPAERAELIARAVARLDGLDLLDRLLADDEVDEVMVNAGCEVWVDRRGELRRVTTLPDGVADVVLERVLAPVGRRLDRTNPIVDARVAGDARLCAVVAPVAIDGSIVSIRRHRRRRLPLDAFGGDDIVDLLGEVVRRRCNVLVSGATSSGKTTLLASLADAARSGERLVIIEDTSEIVVGHGHHVVRLESRPAGVDGVSPIDLAQLVRAALRLRPDRLIVGEFRGAEVVAVVEAMNTGHDGSMSTCHANGAVDALRRIETLVMQAAPTWPLVAIRRQVTRSIDVVVHLERTPDGTRSIREVLEVDESDGEPSGRRLVDGGHRVGDLGRWRS